MYGAHEKALEAVNSVSEIVSEILIIDTGIDPLLLDKLKRTNIVKVIPYKKNIKFAELVREDVKKLAKNNSILFFDQDEIIPAGLKKELLKNSDKDYIGIHRKNIIFGKWIRHSRWWPDYQIRFIKKNSVVWKKNIDLHIQPEIKGEGIFLEPKEETAMIHHNYNNIDEYLNKSMHYAKVQAVQLFEKNQPLTFRKALTDAISEFISRFFANEGYKDGSHGLVLAFLQMFYSLTVFFYYWELNKYPEIEKKELIKNAYSFFEEGLIESNYWITNKKLTEKAPLIKLENKILNFFRKIIQ